MDEIVARFIHTRHIDSFQKLYFLLFLHEHPDMNGTNQDFSNQLYLANQAQLTKIITDLQAVGLVDQIEDHYKLHNQPDVEVWLEHLAKAFDDPMARQQLLKYVEKEAVLHHH